MTDTDRATGHGAHGATVHDERERSEEELRVLRELRIETLAVGADTRSRQAMSVASDVKRDAWTIQDHTEWWADEERKVARQQRWMRRLIVLTAAVVTVALVGAFFAFTLADRARLQNQVELDRFKQSAMVGCMARNQALAQQMLVYEEFIAIEKEDVSQGAALAVEKQEAYERALASLPDPVDCSVWR